MKCFKKGKFPNGDNFLINLKKFKNKNKEIYNSNDIVFVTKDSIEKFKDIDIKLVLLSNIPSFDEFIFYTKKYPNKIYGYSNNLTRDIYFPQIIKVINSGMLWIIPHVKVKIEEILAKRANLKK